MTGVLDAWDANVFSRTLPGSSLARIIEERAAVQQPVAIAAPALAEMVGGYEAALRRGRISAHLRVGHAWRERVVADRLVEVLPLDEPAARTLGVLRGRASPNRSTSWAFDAAIAATCWVHGYAVVTRNRSEFDELADLISAHIGGERLVVASPPV